MMVRDRYNRWVWVSDGNPGGYNIESQTVKEGNVAEILVTRNSTDPKTGALGTAGSSQHST